MSHDIWYPLEFIALVVFYLWLCPILLVLFLIRVNLLVFYRKCTMVVRCNIGVASTFQLEWAEICHQIFVLSWSICVQAREWYDNCVYFIESLSSPSNLDNVSLLVCILCQLFSREPLIPITSAAPNQIEKALVDFHRQSMSKLANVEGKLQLLIIILPDVKGSYGECYVSSNWVLRFGIIFLNLCSCRKNKAYMWNRIGYSLSVLSA